MFFFKVSINFCDFQEVAFCSITIFSYVFMTNILFYFNLWNLHDDYVNMVRFHFLMHVCNLFSSYAITVLRYLARQTLTSNVTKQ